MTYLVAGMVVLLSLVSIRIVDAGLQASVDRVRAQAAADAAALAAALESVPGMDAAPRPAAERFARQNDARLLECLCEPGSTAMQVTVAIGGARATARAVFDPTLMRPRPRTPGH